MNIRRVTTPAMGETSLGIVFVKRIVWYNLGVWPT
jgi:hypothetical protein